MSKPIAIYVRVVGMVVDLRQILTLEDDALRIATVQCCLKLLNADGLLSEVLLECDISGNRLL